MSKQVFVKPTQDALVRFPKTMNILPDTGSYVQFNSYWRRRLRDGSVFISKPEKKIVEKEEEDFKEDKKGGRK